MNRWIVIYKLAWAVLLVLFGFGLVCAFLPKGQRVRELQRRKARLQQDNLRIEAEIRDLVRKEQRFRGDPEFVEYTAREEGMVKPHERIFRYTNEQTRADVAQ